MASPFTFEDSLRAHDQAVSDWLKGLLVDYNDAGGILTSAKDNFPILQVFSTPDRFFSDMVDLLVRQNWITGNTAADMRLHVKQSGDSGGVALLPLPAAMIEVGDPQPSSELSHVPYPLLGAVDDLDTNGRRNLYPYPAPYLIDYTITFWMRNRFTRVHIQEWIMSQFGNVGAAYNEMFLTVKHKRPYQDWAQRFQLGSPSDASDLEGANPPYKRVIYPFTLRAWVCKPPVATWSGLQAPMPP